MKVLIVGGGAREHALAWSISRSPRVDALMIAPGNGGTAQLGANLAIEATDIEALLAAAREHKVDLTVVGPEAPLMEGIVDRFRDEGLLCYGPCARAAQLEGSKVFAKNFMDRWGIPTAGFKVFDDVNQARTYIESHPVPVVVKVDGLAAGKGVYIVDTVDDALAAVDEIMVGRRFGEAGARITVEEFLTGEEVSVHAICAGGRALVLPSSQDHKRAHDGDNGPNTGGMGAYAPVPSFDDNDMNLVVERVIKPTLSGLEREGIDFSGTLYAGLMRTAAGPFLLEYNVRFGDPETEVILPLIKSDLFELLYSAARGNLPDRVELHEGRSAATVVMASSGYPGSYKKGFAITGLDSASGDSTVPFHAGTLSDGSGTVTSGGRVLAVTAWNDSIEGALLRAYDGVGRIKFDGAFWRTDIGRRALGQIRKED